MITSKKETYSAQVGEKSPTKEGGGCDINRCLPRVSSPNPKSYLINVDERLTSTLGWGSVFGVGVKGVLVTGYLGHIISSDLMLSADHWQECQIREVLQTRCSMLMTRPHHQTDGVL